MCVAVCGGQRPASRPPGDQAQAVLLCLRPSCQHGVFPLQCWDLVSSAYVLFSGISERSFYLLDKVLSCIAAVWGAFSSVPNVLGMKQILKVDLDWGWVGHTSLVGLLGSLSQSCCAPICLSISDCHQGPFKPD